MKERIVFVDFLAAVAGGQVTRARAFMQRIYEADRHSLFVVLKEGGSLDDAVAPGGRTRVIDVELGDARLKGVRRMAWEARHVPRLIARHEATVYLTFSHFLPPRVICPVRIVGVSNMAPFSERAMAVSGISQRIRLGMLRRSILSSARRATHVVALSNTCRNALLGAGIASDSIVVLSNGADDFLDAVNGVRRSNSGFCVSQRPYVLCVSHFYAYKDFETLLDGFAGLAPALREKYSLRIVGAPMDERYFARISARARRLADRCVIDIVPGLPRSELPSAYVGASAFVCSSLIENSPNALLEAMAAGLPSVLARCEPMPEFARDAALYYEPRCPTGLTSALSTLLQDPELSDRLRVRARERASMYRWDDLVRGTVRIYAGASSSRTVCQ